MSDYKFFFYLIFFIILGGNFLNPTIAQAGTLTASITTAAACTGGNKVILLRLSGTTNAHAELPGQTNYTNNVVCGDGVVGLGNSCSGTFDTVAKLSGTSNAHIEQNTESNYANSACISAPYVSVGYQASNCTGFDTTIGSMSGTTNAHVGDSAAYTTKICATADVTAPPESLSCSVTTAAACTGGTKTVIYRMSGSSNAHAELPSQSTAAYASNVVCCSGVTGMGNSCTGTFATPLKLSGTTNAHVQQTGSYPQNACISAPSGGSVSIGYQSTNCTGFDTTLGSMSAADNAHVGNISAYTTKICGTMTGSTGGLPVSDTLTSSVFDTTSTSASISYNSIMWKGTQGTGQVRFQLSAASATTGPWNFYGGATCGALDWFSTSGPDSPVELKGTSCVSNWNNKRYFRYKVQICSGDCATNGATSPTIDDIIVNWSS